MEAEKRAAAANERDEKPAVDDSRRINSQIWKYYRVGCHTINK